ncbi:PilZ domain-containing protein [Francisella tularensis]|uniref:PilZ domain-containing protein n=1 Tax=Francisella tularensis TaxID=263 RepID=UPI000F4D73E9|nr:PilZ domain-containing protein [Francisella tularensis]ROZ73363.1 PilZ domain-containing protein [Francisella tularensis]
MSRLDLLKKATPQSKKPQNTTKRNPRGGMLAEKTQKSQQRIDDLNDDILAENDFENELEDTPITEYQIDDDTNNEESQENINIIEIDIDQSEGLAIDPTLISEDDESSEDESPKQKPLSDNHSVDDSDDYEANDIVEGNISVDYSEEDIKLELEYSFDQRDQLYNHYVKLIKDGGIEVSSPKILYLHDIISISVTLTELKEQVGCKARVISVFPQSIPSSIEHNNDKYRYIVQFIGPNAPETERVLSKYLLGYKQK